MSQMVTRKRTGGDEKEKRTESPVKDMKKKMAANAEKEKNAADQATSKPDKPTEKPADKPTDKPASKSADKPAEKTADKPQKADKAPEKPAEKKQEKAAEKKDGQSDKKKEENGKGESSAKTDKPGKPDSKPKQNGSNGVNGTVSPESDSDELVIDETDETELFPELAYDDSDVEWEPGMDCPSRSLTRRSQVKVARTPETPRPASDKDTEESKDSKVLKLSQEAKTPETPKEKKEAKDAKKAEAQKDIDVKKAEEKEVKEAKKAEAKEAKDAKKAEETEVKEAKKAEAKEAKDTKKAEEKEAKEAKGGKDGAQAAKADAKKEIKESPRKEDKGEKSDKVEVEVVVDIESCSDPSEESRKPDTNFSKSRVKVSPYRRSIRIADQTTSSMAANYTGNNTTMEMDITESSFMEESMDDSYLSGLRSIKGRRSYKPLKEMALRGSANRSVRSVTSTIVTEPSSRPTAPVVGRKRKPEPEDNVSVASEAEEVPVAGKRQRLLDRLARPFRRAALMPARRNAEIVGINTDLPLSAPVASTSQFDPETIESLKPAPTESTPPVLTTGPVTAEDSKRCVIM